MLSHASMNIGDSIYTTDTDDKIIFVNKAFCETYGFEREDILEKYDNVFWKEGPAKGDVKDILPCRVILIIFSDL